MDAVHACQRPPHPVGRRLEGRCVRHRMIAPQRPGSETRRKGALLRCGTSGRRCLTIGPSEPFGEP